MLGDEDENADAVGKLGGGNYETQKLSELNNNRNELLIITNCGPACVQSNPCRPAGSHTDRDREIPDTNARKHHCAEFNREVLSAVNGLANTRTYFIVHTICLPNIILTYYHLKLIQSLAS